MIPLKFTLGLGTSNPLARLEQVEISMMTVDNSNGQSTFQLDAIDT